ncbi:hypothetical protein YYC_03576 [Plasmodium yoelii 17X]|uniref:FAD-binding domain-containing protein n=1 Tax=Plasmodium yoelii 17X TaxID=1323249 RepID=V7PGT2_PLAYE|nr:hypothetical protein YYC_03576 [Plasmodium yoelii 17X]
MDNNNDENENENENGSDFSNFSNFYTNIKRRKDKINKRMETDVLIVGATTGGLILSLDLFRKNIKHIIIDSCEKNVENTKINEQYLLYPRTLEMLHDLNILPEILSNSLKLTGINFYIQNKLINQSSKNFFQSINGNMPYMLSINKMSLNKILLKKIKLNGSKIWYNTLLSPIQNQSTHFINCNEQNKSSENISKNNKLKFYYNNVKVKKLYTLPSLLKNREVKNALIKNNNNIENNNESYNTSKNISDEKDNTIDINLITSNSNSIFSNLSNKNISSNFSFYCSTDSNDTPSYDNSDKTYSSNTSCLSKFSSDINNKYKIEGYIKKTHDINNENNNPNIFCEKNNPNIFYEKNNPNIFCEKNNPNIFCEKNDPNIFYEKNARNGNITGATVRVKHNYNYWDMEKNNSKIGVDGKHSIVRKLFNIKMKENENNDIEYISADICAKWSNEMHYYNLSLFQSEYGFVTCFPIFFDISNVDENNFYSTNPKFKDTIKNMKKEVYIRKNNTSSNYKKTLTKPIKKESFEIENPQKLTINTLSGLPINTLSGLPINTLSGLPINTLSGLPVDTLSGLPKCNTMEPNNITFIKKYVQKERDKPRETIHDKLLQQNDIEDNKFHNYYDDNKQNLNKLIQKRNRFNKSYTNEILEKDIYKKKNLFKMNKPKSVCQKINDYHEKQNNILMNKCLVEKNELNINLEKKKTKEYFMNFIKKYEEKFTYYIKNYDNKFPKDFSQKNKTTSFSIKENDTNSILIKNKNTENLTNESLKEDTDNNYVDALSNNSMNEINNRASEYAKLGIYNWHITICRKIDKSSQNKYLYPIKKSKEIKYIEVIKLINKIFPNTELYYLYNLKIGIHKDKICTNYYNNYVVLAGEANCFYNPLFNVSVNLTIHDIYNIGWKLKYIISHGCTLILLEGYEKERKYISEKVVSWNRDKLNFIFINNNGNNNNICTYYNILFFKFFAYIFQKFPTNYNIFEKLYLSTFLLQHNYTNYVINNTRNIFFCNKNNNICADRAKNCILKFISSFNKIKENKNVSLYDYLKNQMHTLILCINISKKDKPICNYITTHLLKNKYNKKYYNNQFAYTYDKAALKKLIKIARLTHNIMGKKGTKNNNNNCRHQPFLKILWILCNQNKSDFIQTNKSICSTNFNVYTRNFTISSYNIPNELINTIKNSKIKDQVILYDFINDFQKQYNINFYLPNNLIYQPNFQSAIYIFIRPDFHITHINYVNDDNQIASFLDHVYNFYG